MTTELLEQAVAALEDDGTEAVLGHTDDGGYWGIGLHRSRDELFVGVPMSQDDTGAFQLARLQEHGLVVDDALPVLVDVDDITAARQVAANAPETRFAVTLEALGHTASDLVA